jgi:hypothetical protein
MKQGAGISLPVIVLNTAKLIFFIKISGDLKPNVVGSQTMFTLLITKFTAFLKTG